MFLDYDSTLSPIVDDPNCAFMSDAMRDAVGDGARYFLMMTVSERCHDKRGQVYNFLKLAQLFYVGSRGMEIKVIEAKGPSFMKANAKTVLCQPASKYHSMIGKVYKILLETIKSTPGAKVENNYFFVSTLHMREWSALVEQVKSVLEEYPKPKLTLERKL
ncbi:hypothetical protein IEQ34_013423 [Dendrobium chrysotoxum]|uniref:Uncharacterized protein n=1 Tax=Dendrobium chrysotoxum TaxID=161865 RepID=A0AAV7GQX6_DENCH|nr:hypothetical protein IEQ34_013423 [Dendrobium chrysotoxum]